MTVNEKYIISHKNILRSFITAVIKLNHNLHTPSQIILLAREIK